MLGLTCRKLFVSSRPISNTIQVGFPVRFYQSTKLVSKKSSDKKSKGDDDSAPVKLPDVKTFEKLMDNSVTWFTSELAKIKVGRLTADVFANVSLESYGTIGKAGQVTMKTPTKLVVAVYDPSATKNVAEALRSCGLGVNPSVEGSNVIVNVPKPSKEARDTMSKNASRLLEKVSFDYFFGLFFFWVFSYQGKESLRNVRKGCLDQLKPLKSKISEDDVKRFTKEVKYICFIFCIIMSSAW
jgi:ribosome recycling factor